MSTVDRGNRCDPQSHAVCHVSVSLFIFLGARGFIFRFFGGFMKVVEASLIADEPG